VNAEMLGSGYNLLNIFIGKEIKDLSGGDQLKRIGRKSECALKR